MKRSEARAAGLTRYNTGELCVRGHLADRMVSSRRCVVCLYEDRKAHRLLHPEQSAASRRAWAKANPERNKANKKAWHEAHPEVAAKRARRWYLANKEKANSQRAAWAKRNPGKVAALAANRRARELKQTPKWADLSAIEIVYQRAAELRRAGQNVEVDHVIPLAGRNVSGLHVESNLQILSLVHNRSKSNRFQLQE